MSEASPYMTEREAAEYLGIAAGTLRNWRSTKPRELPAIKRGRMVRYSRSVVENYFSETPNTGAEAPQETAKAEASR